MIPSAALPIQGWRSASTWVMPAPSSGPRHRADGRSWRAPPPTTWKRQRTARIVASTRRETILSTLSPEHRRAVRHHVIVAAAQARHGVGQTSEDKMAGASFGAFRTRIRSTPVRSSHGGPRRTATRPGRQAYRHFAHERGGDARTAQVQLEQQHALFACTSAAARLKAKAWSCLPRAAPRSPGLPGAHGRALFERARAGARAGSPRRRKKGAAAGIRVAGSGQPSTAAGAGRPRGNARRKGQARAGRRCARRGRDDPPGAPAAPASEEPVNPNIGKKRTPSYPTPMSRQSGCA